MGTPRSASAVPSRWYNPSAGPRRPPIAPPQATTAAGRAGVEVHTVPDAAAGARTIPELVRDGDLVVVKGSRGVRLEQVVDALVARRGEAA